MVTRVGGSGNDSLKGTQFKDTLDGRAGNDRLFGLAGDDTLVGAAGNDSLNGGTGKDLMRGGAGNDIYFVDNARDRVDEGSSKSIADQIRASVSVNLNLKAMGSGSIENVILTGA
jgi:Ca2+-binding RTX toxin-like protein